MKGISVKNTILVWLKDEGAITKENNIYHAERAFFANSVIQWCIQQKEGKNLLPDQIENYMKAVKLFLEKKVDLFWEDDIIKIHIFETSAKKREIKKNANTSLENSHRQ